jgi:hypothetical protein
MTSPSPSPRGYSSGWVALGTLGAVLDLIGIGALFWQYVGAYFSIEGPAPQPDAHEILTYDVTSIVAVLVGLALLGVSFWKRLVAVSIVQAVLVVALIVAAVMFAVPQGRWTTFHDAPHSVSPSYTPCYSGSNTCN